MKKFTKIRDAIETRDHVVHVFTIEADDECTGGEANVDYLHTTYDTTWDYDQHEPAAQVRLRPDDFAIMHAVVSQSMRKRLA